MAADSVGRVELCNGGVVDWALTALRSAEYPSDLDDIASWTLWNIALCAQGTSTALSADGVVVAVASLRRHLAAIDGAKGDATGATAVWSTVTNLCGFLLCVICAWDSRAEKQLAADDVTLLVSLVGRRPVTGLALAAQLQTLVVTCLTAALRQPSLQSWVEPSVCVERLGALLRWVEPLPTPLHAKVAELLSLLRLSRTKELSR